MNKDLFSFSTITIFWALESMKLYGFSSEHRQTDEERNNIVKKFFRSANIVLL
jgi:hypothetical protein